MDHFKHAQKEQQRASQILSELCQVAVSLGLSEKGLNASNAALFCFKALDDYRQLKQLAAELGTTLPKVLQGYRMRNRGEELLPPELRYAPPNWIRDGGIQREEFWANGKRNQRAYRDRAVSAATAQRLRAGLQSQLMALVTLVNESGWPEDGKREYIDGIVSSYQSDSYEEFSKELNAELWSLATDKEENQAEPTESFEEANTGGDSLAVDVAAKGQASR